MYARHLFITAGVIGALSLASVCAYAATSAQDFVTKASIANEFEIESSKLALDKSQNNDIKSFAQRMVDDHTKTGDKLKNVLKNSASNAQPATSLDDKHQKLLDTLNAANGKSFDDQYVNIQTDAHKEAVSLFTDYSQTGTDSALKTFATETLPTLKKHLKHVETLQANH